MKTGSLATKLMLAAILLTVLVYFGVNAASYFLDPFSTTLVYDYTSENAVTVSGYVVRDETVLSGGTGDLVYFSRREGEKVSNGGTVALGQVSDEQKAVYDTVLKAHLAVIDYVKPGVVCSDVDKVARDIIEKDYPGTFGHGLGHGVGFEIHEWPRFGRGDSTLAAEGMVVTDEPGIYLPAKYGVRIEDMLLVTADGCRSLTKSPKELICL